MLRKVSSSPPFEDGGDGNPPWLPGETGGWAGPKRQCDCGMHAFLTKIGASLTEICVLLRQLINHILPTGFLFQFW